MAAFAVAAFIFSEPLQAHDGPGAAAFTSAGPGYTYEAWGGADVVATGWSAYSGLTAALFGDVRDNGWRVRGSVSYGRFRYERGYYDSATKSDLRLSFESHRASADALIGYQQTVGPLTVKAFAGLVEDIKFDIAQLGSPIALDDENGIQGNRSGLKIVLETWTRLGDWGFVQADMSWSQPLDNLNGRLRLGYRLTPWLSAGPEAAHFADGHHEAGRVGAFLRAEWAKGEVSLSAGVGGNSAGGRYDLEDAYGSLNAMLRF